ncbi:similarity to HYPOTHETICAL PROTEIN Y461_MYCPN [Encephalitozoon cuniculi GB-M1]|uniref:Uncharacterized protein n=1 Tax=Encephalitozoon cuniculi (strain GB-M1) TaxID=284813 RepID=Q8SW77_ENCCU|nr:uncharacterized protein ECU03_0100 [Encephalitozoon cuniculi GB-M1]CAD26157.1 similarity to HYPOTHETICAL PROTEIN Y461_MYCPN [Encephalitozoon cuniculi GB-M1]
MKPAYLYLILLFLPLSVSREIPDMRDILYEDFHKEMQDPPTPLIIDLMSTDLFRRLDRVAQLGLRNLLFTHANITRGAHCRGTRTMSSIYVNILNKNSCSESCITPVQSHAIQVASLLHDIGHGPYSHLFEYTVTGMVHSNPEIYHDDEKKDSAKPWSHEMQSLRIARCLLQTNDLVRKYNLPHDFADAVCDMIQGLSRDDHAKKYASSPDFNKYVIFTIVNGDAEASLDTDKFDYMRRDSYLCCRPGYANLVSQAVTGIMLGSRIEHDRIVYSIRCAESLVVFSHCVYLNYRYLYYNPQAGGLDLVLQDILTRLLSHANLTRYLQDINSFSILDDMFIARLWDKGSHVDIQHLLDRFNARDSYEFIGYRDYPYPPETSPNHDLTNLRRSIADIKHTFSEALGKTQCEITNDDYVLVAFNFAHILKGNGTKNILAKVLFHDPIPNPESFYSHKPHLDKYFSTPGCTPLFKPIENADSLAAAYEADDIPFYWGSIQLRLYARTVDNEKTAELKRLFKNVILN